MADPKILSKLKAMTPYQVYLEQIRSTFDGIRASNNNVNYYPAQIGGLAGQRQVMSEADVIDVITFEVE